jgi:putative mRNA 3-end processing factor
MPNLATRSPLGLYCEPSGFYIAPWLPADRAVITRTRMPTPAGPVTLPTSPGTTPGPDARPAGRHRDAGRPGEPVRCDVLVTENPLGLPIYRWAPQTEALEDMHAKWADGARQSKHARLMGYSLGKAHRLVAGLATAEAPDPADRIEATGARSGQPGPFFWRAPCRRRRRRQASAALGRPSGSPTASTPRSSSAAAR